MGARRALQMQIAARLAVLRAVAVFAALASTCSAASAEDILKVAIGQITNWENQPATLGMQAGIFQKHTSGAVTNTIVLAFVKELGVKAKPTATGGPPATLTQVMSGQIDVGWSVPPLGIAEAEQGKIRIIARGSDLPEMRDQTLTVVVVNADALRTKQDAIVRFMQAYRETIDWMYSNPEAIRLYAEKISKPESLIRRAVEEFLPKESISPDRVSGVDAVMAEAINLKFIEKPLTKDELAEFIRIPARGG
jgi:NitT/TauT family transport system substrate-binding protein